MSAISPEQILHYINLARTSPKNFAQYVKKQISQFVDNQRLPLRPYCYYRTNQGKGAWHEAYQFLKNQASLHPYKLNVGLSLASMDHAIDMQNNNFMGHNSSDGTSSSQRIQKRCGKAYGKSGQNIGSDFNQKGRNHALQTVMGLIIDDGVSNRGHRKNILSPDFKYIGIYSTIVGDKIFTCIDFHSEELKTIQPSKKPIVPVGGYKVQKSPQNYSHNNFNGGNHQIAKKGQKYVVSESTNTKTSTINGKTTKIVTKNFKYSDGSTEQVVQKSHY